jgi:signal transduction histidine kinase
LFLSKKDPTNEELRQRLRLAEESLRRSEHLVIAGRFAGAIMHEVNNPLEALSNLVYLTKLDATQPDNVLKNMHIAEAQLKRLGEITRQTLSFYRDQSEASTLDLVEIAESALRIHAHRITSRSIELRKNLPAKAEIEAVGDALPEKGAVLCFRVRTDAKRAHIIISDNGHGIHPSIRKTLFDPYVTSKKSGTGVGLWLSKSILDKHKGTIRFRSSREPGKSGTTFRVSLPVSLQRSH